MRAKHITSEHSYRTPFGACPLGESVTLSIDVWDVESPEGQIRLWVDGEGETLVPMTCTFRDENGERVARLTGVITPEKTQIIWYFFMIKADDGSVWRYGARNECSVGEGTFTDGEPRSFQITVYEHREVRPLWYQHGIVYQIFPDRFDRGQGWHDLAEARLAQPHNGPGRTLVHDWRAQPNYHKDQYGRISTWDFYGGNLDGIRERLGYLKSMGVSVIYLNPIFEAASNHRYDTADYMQIDPMLGDKETFVRLCDEARELGISIILDGVFNHTGCDSRYFNKYGNYPEVGAFQSADSPYASWYKFGGDNDGEYQCWWGVDDLPDVDEEEPTYREFICGENGVVRTWLRLGASGWRLDVADELPDSFIEEIKAAALAEKPDALVIGEVWEDASNKVSYGQLRRYLQGRELDGVMNYPFRSSMLNFLTNKTGAHEIVRVLEELCENYPREAYLSCLNLLGSHDRERLLTVLGDAPDKSTLSDEQRRDYRLTEGQRGLAVSRLWVAALLQMTMPGVPCIYYGDEAGLEGYTDPYNRGTYPWGDEDENCRTIYRNAIAVRKSLPEVFEEGDFVPFSTGDDEVFGFWRTLGDTTVCVLANASLQNSHTVSVPMCAGDVDDIVQGKKPVVSADGSSCSVHLWPLGTAVLYFHEQQRLQRPMERGMGVLCHITSVPNNGEPGTLGEPAKRFVDVLADAGQTYWQVLPVNPTDEWGSPYAGLSAFAGNPYLMEGFQTDLDDLVVGLEDDPGYAEFCKKNEAWLEPYVAFRAIKEAVGDDIPWPLWPENLRTYKPGMADTGSLAANAETHRRAQYVFQRQWDELKAYANERGIKIVGDMPMYVSADSSDVWAERSIFALDEKGNPAGVAGCPPDNFAKDGQIWGNPTFRWDVLRKSGYDWWMRRLERMLELYDYVRLDHFLGFSSYYNIPGGRGALEGAWYFGPGLDLFRVAHERFGDLPFIGEDLGTITPAVRFLVATTGFPGMDVVQFYNEDVRQGYVPVPGKICYPSTHDTQTLVGWIKDKWPGESFEWIYRDIMSKCLNSSADVVIVPLQDVLVLDDSARMNVPGVADGNWSWRADNDSVNASIQYLASLAHDSGRRRQ